VDFLLEELSLPPGGSILDVGCGTGRHAGNWGRRPLDIMNVSARPFSLIFEDSHRFHTRLRIILQPVDEL